MNRQQPIYQQIADVIREKIEKGEYPFGKFIPSERELAQKYGVNRMTLRKAIAVLVNEGLLIPRPGKGTYVNRPKIDSAFDTIQGTTPFLMDMGLTPSNRLIYSGRRKAGWKFSRIFDISPEDDIFQIFRVRLGDAEPYILEYTSIPYQLIPEIEKYDFSIYSLYDIYNKHGIRLVDDLQTLEIVKLCPPQSTLLNLAEDEYAFMTTETTFSSTGDVIEYTKSYSSGKKFVFSTVMV